MQNQLQFSIEDVLTEMGFLNLKPLGKNPNSDTWTYLVQDRKGGKKVVKHISNNGVTGKRKIRLEDRLNRVNKALKTNLYLNVPDIGELLLVDDYIEGINLRDDLVSRNAFNENEINHFLISTLNDLDQLHKQKVVHGDIKPSNIIQDTQGNYHLKDFDLTMSDIIEESSELLLNDKTITYSLRASPHYAKASFKKTISDDLYSLGRTAIHLLSGKIPGEVFEDDRKEYDLNLIKSLDVNNSTKNFLKRLMGYDSRKFIFNKNGFKSAQEALKVLSTKNKYTKRNKGEKRSLPKKLALVTVGMIGVAALYNYENIQNIPCNLSIDDTVQSERIGKDFLSDRLYCQNGEMMFRTSNGGITFIKYDELKLKYSEFYQKLKTTDSCPDPNTRTVTSSKISAAQAFISCNISPEYINQSEVKEKDFEWNSTLSSFQYAIRKGMPASAFSGYDSKISVGQRIDLIELDIKPKQVNPYVDIIDDYHKLTIKHGMEFSFGKAMEVALKKKIKPNEVINFFDKNHLEYRGY